MNTNLSCPRCGYYFDSHMAVGEAALKKMKAPDPGSILICLNCGELSILDEAGKARFMSEIEASALPPDVVQLLAASEDCRQTVLRRNGVNPFGRTG